MVNKNLKITIIGTGNMGSALIKGLLNAGYKQITACDSDQNKLQKLETEYKIKTTNEIKTNDIVILAVKPNNFKEVLPNFINQDLSNTIFISVAAGITTNKIKQELSKDAKIVRVMPNIPAVVGEGCSAIYSAETENAEIAKNIFSTIGKCLIVKEENQIDISTALCGSGPAFFALFIEHLSKAAQKLGLPQESAEAMALQTAFGTCKYLIEQNISTKKLQEMVSSPAGTTVAGLNNFGNNDLEKVVYEALEAATNRAREIASQH